MRRVLTNFNTIDVYIANRDLDTGQVVKPGAYPLTDHTYAKLLFKLTEHPTTSIPAQLKHDVANFYADPSAPIVTRKDPQQWQAVQRNLQVLAAVPATGTLNPDSYEGFDTD
jgi:hypothetical protein